MIYTDTDSGGEKWKSQQSNWITLDLCLRHSISLKWGEVIEKRIPKGRNRNLLTSTIIKAMIIDEQTTEQIANLKEL